MFGQIESKRATNPEQTAAFFKSQKATDYFSGVLEVHRVAQRISASLELRKAADGGESTATEARQVLETERFRLLCRFSSGRSLGGAQAGRHVERIGGAFGARRNALVRGGQGRRASSASVVDTQHVQH